MTGPRKKQHGSKREVGDTGAAGKTQGDSNAGFTGIHNRAHQLHLRGGRLSGQTRCPIRRELTPLRVTRSTRHGDRCPRPYPPPPQPPAMPLPAAAGTPAACVPAGVTAPAAGSRALQRAPVAQHPACINTAHPSNPLACAPHTRDAHLVDQRLHHQRLVLGAARHRLEQFLHDAL